MIFGKTNHCVCVCVGGGGQRGGKYTQRHFRLTHFKLPVLLVESTDNNGKKNSSRRNVLQDLDERDVRVREQDIDPQPEISQSRLDHLRVLPLALAHAHNLAVVLHVRYRWTTVQVWSGVAVKVSVRWRLSVVVVVTSTVLIRWL